MKRIFALLFCLIFVFSLVSCRSKGHFTTGEYKIEFNAELLGEQFSEAENEIKGCDYRISFAENGNFSLDLGFSSTVYGVWAAEGEEVICTVNSYTSEYSPEQDTAAELTFKVVSQSELEVSAVSQGFTIYTTELTENGYELTSEQKELEFWPIVKGIKYKIA